MKKIRDIIKEIGNEDSTNRKIELLKKYSDNSTLKCIMNYAYNNQYIFRIKSDESRLPKTYTDTLSIHDALLRIEENILGRKVIGNNARDFLEYTLGFMNEEDAIIIHNMINKDLKIGVASSTINKVWKNLIPKQPQLLASPCNEKTLRNINYENGAYAQLKADGARCFINIKYFKETDDITIKMTTRDSNEYHGLEKIKNSLLFYMKTNGHNYEDKEGNVEIELDGELVVFNDDGHTKRAGSNGIMNKSVQGTISDEEQKTVNFLTWDIIDARTPKEEYSKRLENLTKLVETIDGLVWHSPIKLIETTVVFSLDEAREVYRKYVDMGLEGIILKNIDSVWENRRSKNLVKFKEVIEVDLEVIGFTQIKTGENKLGSLQLRSSCGMIEVSCGSGFTDTTRKKIKGEWNDIPLSERHEYDRELLWENREDLSGKIVQIKCNGLVKDKTKEIHSLYLPIFQCFRFDKSEANKLEDVF